MDKVIIQRETYDWPFLRHGPLDPDTGNTDTVTVTRDGVQLLAHRRFTRAIGVTDAVIPGLFPFDGCRFAFHRADPLKQAIGDSIIKGHGKYGGVIAIAARFNIVTELTERVVLAVMGTDDNDTPAPDKQCRRCIQYALYILVECRFVDNHHALQTTDVGWPGRERSNLEPAGKADPIGRNHPGVALFVLVLEEKLLDGRDVLCLLCCDDPGELGHVADEFQPFLFGITDVVDVVAASGFLRPGDQGRVKPPGKGDAGTTAFRDSQNGHIKFETFHLVGHQHTVCKRVEAERDFPGPRRKLIPFNGTDSGR